MPPQSTHSIPKELSVFIGVNLRLSAVNNYNVLSINPAFFTNLSMSTNTCSKSSILCKGHAFGPSDNALLGSGCVSINTPAMPLATAARANTGTNSRWPPLLSPWPPGCCTECVASNTTGQLVSRIIARPRISEINVLEPKLAPRSHTIIVSAPPLASLALFTTCYISCGAKN